MCFVFGRGGLSERLLRGLEEEERSSGDILWLPHTSDGCFLSISKVHDWWRAAASSRVPHVAKVDDDSFLNVPKLVAELRRLACVPNLYYGGGGFAGYHPSRYVMCGFSWRGPGAFHKYGCHGGGAHPPFPFVLGGLQVLSASLAAFVARSPDVAAFVARSDAALNYTLHRRTKQPVHDDVLLGYWLAAPLQPSASARPNVTYAFVNTLTPNLDCDLSNGMYKQPSNASVLLHNVKNPAWLPYVWRVVAEGATHDKARCKRAKNAEGAGAGLRMLAGSCVERFGSAGHVAGPGEESLLRRRRSASVIIRGSRGSPQ